MVLALGVAALAGEVALRVADGYRLASLRLTPVREPQPMAAPITIWPTEGANEIARPHLAGLPTPDGVDPAWFLTDPEPAPPKPARSDLEAPGADPADQTQAKFARRIWNLNFVVGQAKRRQSYWDYLKQIKTPIQVFDPPGHSEYPRYRLRPDDPYAEAWPTGTMATNNLGYRGRDVSVAKPPRTMRIVFVGASTTIDHYSFRLSLTDYAGHYLNLWARARGLDVQFETINTAREGLQSSDLAAVVEQEVLALAPDIVVYKEGANQFGEAKRLLSIEPSPVKPITPAFLATGVVGSEPANYYSNTRRRLDLALAAARPIGEAPRPPYTVNWPAGLSEETPDLSRADLPLDLATIVRDLGRIRELLTPTGADLAVSSFVWMAEDGLRLNGSRANERALYWYLNGNDVIWPLSYRDIRRFADFQNRVFQRFTTQSGTHFIDLARWFPRDPSLFVDGIHISYPGVKMHGWITFLELLPLVEARLKSHAVTQPAAPAAVAFSTVTIADLVQRQAAGAQPLPMPPLEQWRPASSDVRVTLDELRASVSGASVRWAYQFMSPGIPVAPHTQYLVSLDTRVTSGVIGIGVLDQTGQSWISSPLDAAPFTFDSGTNSQVQLVIADATPTLGTVRPSIFEVRRDRP